MTLRNNSAREVFTEIVQSHLRPRLGELGFSLVRGDCFCCWQDDCLHRIAVDFLKDRVSDYGRIAIYLGIGFRSLARYLIGCPILGAAITMQKKQPCCFSVDLSNLHTRVDSWHWDVSVDTSATIVAKQILQDLGDFGFPFLKQYLSIEDMIMAWESKEQTSALSLHELGYLAGCYMLQEMPEKAVAAIERYRKKRESEWRQSGNEGSHDELREVDQIQNWIDSQIAESNKPSPQRGRQR